MYYMVILVAARMIILLVYRALKITTCSRYVLGLQLPTVFMTKTPSYYLILQVYNFFPPLDKAVVNT